MRTHDIVVYGATGFTGRQAALELARAAKPTQRLAIAGRRKDALQEVARTLGREVAIVVADSADAEAIDRMCADTRVVANTAGPFALHGNHVVAACVKHATHYADITGETPWVRDMLDKHAVDAFAHRARIVPFSGYDSIPSDYSAWLAVHALSLEARAGRVHVEVFHRARGGFNGGTLLTAMNMTETGRMRDVQKPFLLNDAPRAATEHERDPTTALPPRDLPTRGKRYPAPFFMSQINSRVVRRSVELSERAHAPWAAQVEYQEYWGAKTKREAQVIALGSAIGNRTMATALGRKVIKRFGPKPGQGPSEKTMNEGRFEAVAVARAHNGEVAWGEVSGPGDPGNRATTHCLVQATLCLAEDELAANFGFLTPTMAYGEHLVTRLRAAGMTLKSGRA